MSRLLLVLVVMLALGGCAETYRIRPIATEERATLGAAAGPLLTQLEYTGPRRRCAFGVTLNDVEARQLEVMPSSEPDYCLQFVVTAGALRLPPAEVRALVAHGLAHVQLGHARTTGRRAPVRLGRSGAPAGDEPRTHTAEEERDADRYAARLLNLVSLEPGGPDCLALGAVLERSVAEKARWREWSDMHPTGAARVAAARRSCELKR